MAKSTVPLDQGSKKLKLGANYVRLHCINPFGVYQYHIDFEPEVGKGLKYKMLAEYDAILGPARVFDGGSILYTPTRITDKELALSPSVKIKLVRVFGHSSRECVTVYNVLLRRVMVEVDELQAGGQTLF